MPPDLFAHCLLVFLDMQAGLRHRRHRHRIPSRIPLVLQHPIQHGTVCQRTTHATHTTHEYS
jgi:hypothetical protein